MSIYTELMKNQGDKFPFPSFATEMVSVGVCASERECVCGVVVGVDLLAMERSD